MGPKKYRKKCTVHQCKKRQCQREKLSFFSYPKDTDRRELWMMNCKTEYLADKLTRPNSYRVCEIHFENSMFLNSNTRTRLIYNAVPTIFSCKYKCGIEKIL